MSATIKDIAKETGLGLATISNYLNGGNTREKNRIAIEAAIKKLNYTVNGFARSLKTNRSYTVGILLPELSNTFFLRIITAIEKRLKEENYAVIICDCHDNKESEIDAVEFILSRNVDAIINFPIGYSGKHLKPALENGTPVILLDNLIPELNGKVDSIAIDNYSISRELMELLIKNGHRNIGLITGEYGIYTVDQRISAYEAVMKEHGLAVEPTNIKRCSNLVKEGYDAFCELRETNPDMTAVFATNHYFTLGALSAINDLGLNVPDDISLVAFDYMEWQCICNPPLTVIEQPLEVIGEKAADMVLRRLREKELPNEACTLYAKIRSGDSIKNLNTQK